MGRDAGLSSYCKRPAADFSNRTVVLAAIVVMHALIIYLFTSQSLDRRGRREAAILEVWVVPPEERSMAPPPLPPVRLRESRPIEVVLPDVVLDALVDPPPTIQTIDEKRSPPVSVAAEASTAQPPEALLGPLIGPRPISGPRGADRYPPQSIVANESGRVVMTICISSTGAVDSAKLATSSGFPRIDQAALGIASEYRFKPATRQGHPVPVCVPYRIKFRIDTG
jgi:protein TonB